MSTVIDLFAGLGGFSEAAEQCGLKVIWAGNHWRAAVETHRVNHPGAVVECQDLAQADFTQIEQCDWLVGGPSCIGHTRSRGKERPHHDAARSTAWAMITCAEVHRPEVVIVENVPEFTRWVLFPGFLQCLTSLGYAVEFHELDAADFGVPQNRVRLFIVATRSLFPIGLKFEKQPHKPIEPHIEWYDGRWTEIEKQGRAQTTLARIQRGREELGDRFLLPYYGATRTGRSVHRPIGTLTTHDRYAIVNGKHMRMLSVTESKAAMGFRADYKVPNRRKDAIHMLGNAVPPPLAAAVIREIQRRL